MPEYLAPGVYVEEISTGSKPIEGVSTSVAGFLGRTERGPMDVRYVTSWLGYQRLYGGHLGVDDSFMSYAVQGFFDNGGQRCFVGRVFRKTAGWAQQPLTEQMTLQALGKGAWGNRVFYKILPATKALVADDGDRAKSWVRLRVFYFATVVPGETPIDPDDRKLLLDKKRRQPDAVEDFDNASLDPQSANYLPTAVNGGSQLVRLVVTGTPAAAPAFERSLKPLVGGDATDLKPELIDYEGDLEPHDDLFPELFGQGRGLRAMESVDQVSLLLAPDDAHPNVLFGQDIAGSLIASCSQLKDRFAVLSSQRNFFTKVGKADGRPPFDTTYGAFYYPWIKIYDPYTRDDVLVPPAGHVAGIMARTDIEQGVHKAPANAVVIGAKGLQLPVTKDDQALLNPAGINCLRDFRSDGRGIRVWGARTMTSDPEWKYVNVRRLFLFIEESIDEGTQWVVFEPNAPSTWSRVHQTVSNFLTTVWRNGALVGGTRDEAFFVKCDRTTMTQDDIDCGRLICYIGVAPVKPAEFVIFRIGQKTADA